MNRPLQSTTTAITTLMAAALTAYSARAQVTYSPKQEQVPDFGALVPAHEVSDTLPWGEVVLERVTTAIPWGRGMATVDGHLFVLSRGRHRSEGGVDQSVVDRAGTLWRVDTSKIERVIPGEWAGQAVRNNVSVLAEPTSPPFYLYTYEDAAENDILMGRPYCSLAFDEASRNLFICAYSGAELSAGFRKHGTDAIYRYDLRDSNWHVVEQHDPNVVPREELKAVIPNNYYPHHNPKKNDPPHGWLNGPDGCAVVGDFLYATAKDNHMVVQYDLDGIRRHPDAGPPESRPVIQETMIIRYPDGEKEMEILGPSSVAVHDDYLYLGFRTSSIVVRVPLDDDGDIVRTRNGKVRGDLIAVFEPWDAEKKRSGNLYDIAMSPDGDLFVSMGQEGKVWRITPDPARPFYGHDQTERPTTTPPFLNMTELVGRKTGCNNVFVDESGYLYVSSRSNDTGEGVIHGTIYRAKLNPPTTDASAR